MQQPNLEIMNFVERQILPRYNDFGKSHGLGHVQRVIKNSLALAAVTGADVNMVYIIAAYHDLGMAGPRAIHHITSGKILIADVRLRKWFSTEQLKIMKEAVEDQRASIYGKIVAEADRDLEPEIVFSRAILYGIENYPEKNDEEMWQRFRDHMKEKYGRSGYLKLWIPGSPNAKNLEIIRKTIDNEAELREVFDRIYKQICEQEDNDE